MKVLSIKQPWATLIAKGYKDVENRRWDTKYRGKVLIHAGADKTYWKTLDEFLGDESINIIYNDIIFGNLADQKDEIYSAIVGYATLEDIVEDADSIWAQTDLKHWIFKDAYLFDEPIKAKGKLGLWDYPEITEDNLPPAHKFERKYKPYAEGSTLHIPVAEGLCDINTVDFVELELSQEICHLLFDPEGNFKPFTHIVLYTPNESIKSEITSLQLIYNGTEEDHLTFFNEEGEEVDYLGLRIEFVPKNN